MKQTTVIAYNGGAYGTYLHWLLTTMSSNGESSTPFTATGTSHNFQGPHYFGMERWKEYITSSDNFEFVRTHPKTQQQESLDQNLNQFCVDAKSVIYVYPDHDSQLLVLNNYFDKIWDNWWDHQFTTDINKNKIYDNWPVTPNTNINNIPNWIKREFLSLYLIDAWHAQIEWYHPDRYQHKNCLIVLVGQLLNQPKQTLSRIREFAQLTYNKSFEEVAHLHDQMLALQKFTEQQILCDKILSSCMSSQEFNWEDQQLTLVSEAWVQHHLRKNNIEIQCDKLDIFPTNSVQLKKLLYTL